MHLGCCVVRLWPPQYTLLPSSVLLLLSRKVGTQGGAESSNLSSRGEIAKKPPLHSVLQSWEGRDLTEETGVRGNRENDKVVRKEENVL